MLPAAVNGISCFALIDSGNTFGSVISSRFFNKLPGDLELVQVAGTATIQTAHASTSLQVLGRPRFPLHITLGPDSSYPKVQFRPAVVRDLSMDVNLSFPFLQLHRIDILQSKNCLSFRGLSLIHI